MVKQQLWIANSTLVGLLIFSVGTHLLIKQDVPVFSGKKRRSSQVMQQRTSVVNVEKIYKNDLFDTYVAQPEKGPQAKNLVSPIPQLNLPATSAPPPPKRVAFVAPLGVQVKGIILSPDQSRSIVMVTDQTGKEEVYHVGDKIQDAQVIKLTKNKMVLLRGNGQQETFYLRKPDKLTPGLSKWEYAIKRVDDNLYHLDPVEITKEITSVGEVIEALDLGDAHSQEGSKGVLVGVISHHPLGQRLGLQTGDIITKVNDISAVDAKHRIAIYDAIAELPMGGHIHVTLLRDGAEKTISYLLKRLEKPSPFGNPLEQEITPEAQEEDELFKLGQNAQRQQKRRRFEHAHRTQEQHETALSDMRQRLLENMRERSRTRREQ